MIKVLVINVGGSNHKPKGEVSKPSEKRREVAVNIIKSYKPDLILVQEGNKKFYKTVCKECNDGVIEYKYVNNEETGILYNAENWTIDKPKSDLEKMYDELVHQNIISRESELKGRFHAVILKSKGSDGIKFLCVTYHGRYSKLTTKKKLKITKDFLILLLNYREDNPGLSLILGGDFNVKLDKATLKGLIKQEKTKYENDSSPNCDLRLVPYKQTGNRANIYDHVIVSSTTNVSKRKAVDVFKKIAKLFPEVSKKHSYLDYRVILDHDSIFVKVRVKSKYIYFEE